MIKLKNKLIMVVLATASALCAKPMNVMFILADDLGWADTTLYGHTDYYKTPNLELPVAKLDAVRLDPACGKGTIEFNWIHLLNQSGAAVRKWDF